MGRAGGGSGGRSGGLRSSSRSGGSFRISSGGRSGSSSSSGSFDFGTALDLASIVLDVAVDLIDIGLNTYEIARTKKENKRISANSLNEKVQTYLDEYYNEQSILHSESIGNDIKLAVNLLFAYIQLVDELKTEQNDKKLRLYANECIFYAKTKEDKNKNTDFSTWTYDEITDYALKRLKTIKMFEPITKNDILLNNLLINANKAFVSEDLSIKDIKGKIGNNLLLLLTHNIYNTVNVTSFESFAKHIDNYRIEVAIIAWTFVTLFESHKEDNDTLSQDASSLYTLCCDVLNIGVNEHTESEVVYCLERYISDNLNIDFIEVYLTTLYLLSSEHNVLKIVKQLNREFNKEKQ